MNENQIEEFKDQASGTMKSYGQALADKTEKTEHKLGQTFDDAANAVKEGLLSATEAGQSVASKVSTTASYLRDRKTQDIVQDARVAIVRNPAAAVLIGIAAGFILGRVGRGSRY